MRATLVDWLSEVRDEFRLHAETLFLAASYLDAYLAAKPVSRGRFQLLGMACLWVAAKFEEVYPPPLVAMLAMAENMYTAAELTAMEKEVRRAGVRAGAAGLLGRGVCFVVEAAKRW